MTAKPSTTAPLPSAGIDQRVVLMIAVLAGFITPFDGSSVNIALPTIGTEFAMDAVSLSWVATAYLLAAAVFLVPFGRYSDITGRKRIFTIGISIFTIASFFLIFSPSSLVFILLRVAQGAGSAMIFGTGVAILTSVFPPGRRGWALGIYTTAVYLGLSLGPFLGGIMTQYVGWRSIFLINVPLGILTILLIRWKLPGEWAEARGEHFDLGGSVIYGVALIAIMYGFTLLPDPAALLFIIAGIVCLVVFALWEYRCPAPVLHMRLITGNHVFAFSNLAALINYSATFAITFLVSLYLQYVQGFTPQSAGIILIAQPAVQTVASTFAGRLSDRIEPRVVASAGMGLLATGLFLLTFLSGTTSLWYLTGCLVMLGLGMAFFASPNTNAIMSSVEKRFYSVASGTLGTMRLLGQMLSMGVAAMVFAVYIGRVQITPANHPQFILSLHTIFQIFTVLCIVGILASLVRGKLRE
ncbi:MAG: MFS transporter [Methanomicrobiales archaeon]|nr:MFS transporter [Methanomicrobiales archaeon]